MNARHSETIIIGSGAGGLTTAITLARAGQKLLILEEGAPKSDSPPFSLNEIIQDYRAGGLGVAVGKDKINFAEGKVVGGGTAVNTGYYFRARPENLASIAETWRVQDFTDSDLAPHYDFIESELKPAAYEEELSESFVSAAAMLGLSPQKARFIHRSRSGQLERRSCYDIWGAELRSRGAEILSGVRAKKIVYKSGLWRIEAKNSEFTCKHLFICAGPVETPALLRRSGIRKNVGNGLRFHVFVRAIAEFPFAVNRFSPFSSHVFTKDSLVIGHSPSLPHLIALTEPTLKDAAMIRPDRFLCFYASAPTTSGAKIRNFFFNSPSVFFRINRTDLLVIDEARRLLREFLRQSGAKSVFIDESASLLQSVHLFGSAPMGEREEKCATNSFGEVHGYRNLIINDASLIGGSPGLNPQGIVMAVARRNAMHHLISTGAELPRPAAGDAPSIPALALPHGS